MRYEPKFTKAERISFKILEETCPKIEDALDQLRKLMPKEDMEKIMASYGIEMTDRMYHAIHEIVSKGSNAAVANIRKTVLFEGTYPLRLALVQQIESTMPGPHPEPEIRKWLKAWNPHHPLIGGFDS